MSTHLDNKKQVSCFKKYFFIFAGSISLFLGVIGLFLPVLPTTPFLLLSAWLFAKSSERLYNWLLNNRIFGDYIRRYREGKGIPLRTKIVSIFFLWITIIYSAFFAIDLYLLKIILLIVGVAVTIHLLKVGTYK